jgi:hypothetical protein
MMRRLSSVLLASLLAFGCAGPAKLAQRSQSKLAAGDHWRAWELATRALDKAPANREARAAAAAAAASIAQEWQRRIGAVAETDSLAAAEQVLEFAAFRTRAAPYTTVAVSPDWAREEQTLRRFAARLHYRDGVAAMGERRPKRAYLEFRDAERFVPRYRDAAELADRVYGKALTRVVLVPFRASPGSAALGREVAAEWRDHLARQVAASGVPFTRILDGDAIEQVMTVSQLGGLSRDEALRLGRKAGAERIVWGSIGGVRSDTRLQVFTDVIARRVVEKGADGETTVRWAGVPIEVVARVRTVTAEIEYEVMASHGGGTLARQRIARSTSARVLWTSYAPQGDLDAYVLVSETSRAADPERAKQVESRWKSVCGERTSLRQVLEARRSTRGPGRYERGALTRLMAGAAFVFLEELPPPEDLAFAALSGGWQPLREDLLRLDAIDDVDLGLTVAGSGGR